MYIYIYTLYNCVQEYLLFPNPFSKCVIFRKDSVPWISAIFAQMNVYNHVKEWICSSTQVHLFTWCICVYANSYMYVCMYVCMYIYVLVGLCVHFSMAFLHHVCCCTCKSWVNTSTIHIYIYIYIYKSPKM